MFTVIDSPTGPLTLVGRPGVLTHLYMEGQRHRPPQENFGEPGDAADFADAIAQLEEYFAGTRKEFDLKLEPHGTEFQRRVWEGLLTIPYGETLSYGQLADRIGAAPGASRAVGLANGKNPIGIIVPCHRVIGSSGSLVGYGGGLDRKRQLLSFESGGAGQISLI